MKCLAIALTALGFLCGLTSCGKPHDAEPATTGSAACADLLHRKGQVFDTWFLRSNEIRLGGRRYIAVAKDCADTGGTPSPDEEVFVRRIAGVPLSQAFYRTDGLHRNTIYVAGEVAAAQWRQLPPKVRSLVKHP
jgi:hypothetical protein